MRGFRWRTRPCQPLARSKRGSATSRSLRLVVLLGPMVGCGPNRNTATVVRQVDGTVIVDSALNPRRFAAVFQAARALRQKRPARAVALYARARSFGVFDPYLEARFAHALDAAGQRSRARAVVTAAMEQAPCSGPLWQIAADLERNHGRLRRAVAAQLKAFECSKPVGLRTVRRTQQLLDQMGASFRAAHLMRSWLRRRSRPVSQDPSGGRGPGSRHDESTAESVPHTALPKIAAKISSPAELIQLTTLPALSPAGQQARLRGLARRWLAAGEADAAELAYTALHAHHVDLPLRIVSLACAGSDASAQDLLSRFPPDLMGGEHNHAALRIVSGQRRSGTRLYGYIRHERRWLSAKVAAKTPRLLQTVAAHLDIAALKHAGLISLANEAAAKFDHHPATACQAPLRGPSTDTRTR